MTADESPKDSAGRRGPGRLRILLVMAAVASAFVGVRVWQELAPVFGWRSAVVDTVAPELPPGLADAPLAVLLFSKTAGYRHVDAIPAAQDSVERLAAARGWAVFATENAAVFSDATLAPFDVIVANNTTGDNWSGEQKRAFRRWIEAGGGFVGLHGAGGTGYRFWNWYTDTLLGGARFSGHPMFPQFREGRVVVEARAHPTMAAFGAEFLHTDEWYSFEGSPRDAGSYILATLDESSYGPEEKLVMGGDHPIIWIACPGSGRSFFSALGHVPETYARPDHELMLAAAIEWASRRGAACP